MKIVEVARRRRRAAPLRDRVLAHLERHADEVFAYREESLAEAVGAKVSAVSFTLWALHRDGLIDKEEVDGKMVFGSRRAISDLRKGLGIQAPDPFDRARANRDRIAKRVGRVGVFELLDDVRGSWD